jgi:streptogramin lyase
MRFPPTGTVSTFASDLPAPQGAVPQGLAFDAFGNLFVADEGAGEVLKLDPVGNQSVYAAISTTNLPYYGPLAVAFGSNGSLYVSGGSTSVEEIAASRAITDFAAVPPGPLAFDADGNLDTASGQYGVREFDPNGNVLARFPPPRHRSISPTLRRPFLCQNLRTA